MRHLVAEARRHGATAVAHGCTGKGNDQVRFEVGVRALAPDLGIYAPARVWGLTREDCVELAAKWEIPITVTKEKLYSIDDNLWGKAIECGAIEDPWAPAPDDVYTLTRVTETEPGRGRRRLRGRRAGVARRRRRSAPTSSSPGSARWPGAGASAASTWWRTAGWGSRAARSTSARPRCR